MCSLFALRDSGSLIFEQIKKKLIEKNNITAGINAVLVSVIQKDQKMEGQFFPLLTP